MIIAWIVVVAGTALALRGVSARRVASGFGWAAVATVWGFALSEHSRGVGDGSNIPWWQLASPRVVVAFNVHRSLSALGLAPRLQTD